MKHLLFVLCWLPLSLCAQVFDAGSPQLSWNDFVDEYLSMLDDESEEANVLTLRGYAALDEIEPFLDHPLNLNTATAEDFRAFAFLSAAQIDSLLSYRHRLRAFASPGELMGVRGFGLSPAALAFTLHLRGGYPRHFTKLAKKVVFRPSQP